MKHSFQCLKLIITIFYTENYNKKTPVANISNRSVISTNRGKKLPQFRLFYLLNAVATSTATATVHPTIGLLPIPRNPIISTCAGTEEEPAN